MKTEKVFLAVESDNLILAVESVWTPYYGKIHNNSFLYGINYYNYFKFVP